MATIHFLDVGCADTTIITSEGKTILVDCSSRIEDYEDLLPASKTIDVVFITHQHQDHFKGLKYLKDEGYMITTFVCSPYQRRREDDSVSLEEWNEFNDLVEYFKGQGTKVYKPYRQKSFDKEWWNYAGLTFWMLGPDETIANDQDRVLHDASLVFTVRNPKTRINVCFTGDASDKSLKKIADTTKHYCGNLLHASHHGSLNGAELSFIQKANIKTTIVSTEDGVKANLPHKEALRRYAENSSKGILRTDKSGTIQMEL